MENRMKIGDFVKLTGSTLKTVRYYYKIGLLPKPERTTAGHRLYGPAELNRMRLIKHLKSLGLDLKRIKEILGNVNNNATLQKVLQLLRSELTLDKKNIEERIAKIDKMLNQGVEQIDKYAQTCPEIYNQHQKLYGILDDFQWSEHYQDSFRILAEFWKKHPEQYEIALDYGARCARLASLSEDDPEIEQLARETAKFIKSIGLLDEFDQQFELTQPLYNLRNEMIVDSLRPARKKFDQLIQQYLYPESDKQPGGKTRTKIK
ncbi:MerR family transcriptional regulator [Pelotomaculum isophthalicicum JI]|uniref:MerR family transcriptional regulator n=1 Tax=Pelotomaculum isophthalicicum JI TaxID=947010 RepID=A0A9X4JVQ1_9FIRM|nr:MerR family transcriptional regulator [Pelotomaculum isophthalicicum]MDF9408756.1 MerR family transcriptional regulator [Pelotomaculum isophthalicicum JI]